MHAFDFEIFRSKYIQVRRCVISYVCMGSSLAWYSVYVQSSFPDSRSQFHEIHRLTGDDPMGLAKGTRHYAVDTQALGHRGH